MGQSHMSHYHACVKWGCPHWSIILPQQDEARQQHRDAVSDNLTFSADLVCKRTTSSGEKVLTANFRYAILLAQVCCILHCTCIPECDPMHLADNMSKDGLCLLCSAMVCMALVMS